MAGLRDRGWKTIPWRPSLSAWKDAAAAPVLGGARSRLVYPYSVVPGGIENAAEVAEALAEDPVVRTHYAGFEASKAHVVLLAQPRLAYVSYRVKDTIYWTRNKVPLHKGEKLLSDGKELLRGRCGNRISDAPRRPVALVEPPEISTGAPLLPLPLVALAKPVEPPVEAPAGDAGTENEPAATPPVMPPAGPSGGAIVTPVIIPLGGGGAIGPGSTPGAPAGTPSSAGSPPSTPSAAPAAPIPESSTPAPPSSTGPGSPSGTASKPASPSPADPSGKPVDPPPSTPPSTSAPSPNDPAPPAPASPLPGPSTPALTPPPAAPPGLLEPPLPGTPAAPNGIGPSGPQPNLPEITPPSGTPGTQPTPPPVTPVPEPSTYLLIGCGLAGMALLKRRRAL